MKLRMTALLGTFVVLVALVVGLIPPLMISAAAPTSSLTITKYAPDGITIVDQVVISASQMEATMDVQGDGITHYYTQGPTFVPENIWDPDETLNLKDKGALKGTALSDLCDLVGGAASGDGIKVQASDGYGDIFSYPNVYNTMGEVLNARQGKMAICWYSGDPGGEEGQGGYVPSFTNGMMLASLAETTNAAGQHVFGHNDMQDCLPEENWHYYYDGGVQYASTNGIYTKWINRISIYQGAGQWTLELTGARNQTISQREFENGVSCHSPVEGEPYSYTDDSGTWTGLPLWYLLGYVDDTNTHGPLSYNDSLALAGYDIKVIGSDGYFATFDSEVVRRNNDMLLANQLNGAPLPEDIFPLMLVGPGLTTGEKVYNIVRIELLNIPVLTGWTLELRGATSYDMSQAEFESGAACHPAIYDDGEGNVWSGIPLWTLCGWVDDGNQHGSGAYNDELATAGYDIKVIGSDGYYYTFNSNDIRRNNNYVVANRLNGEELDEDKYPLKLVNPDFVQGGPSGAGIVRIELNNIPDETPPPPPTAPPTTTAPHPTPAAAEWPLMLYGNMDYVLTSTEFESGVNCHGVEYTDDAGTWSGIPLYLLVGYVDDYFQHGAGAFNDDFAAQGYTIKVSAPDYSYEFASAAIANNNNIILANKLNGETLPATDPGNPTKPWYPLKLVGSGISSGAKVGAVVMIELKNVPVPTVTPAPTTTYPVPIWDLNNDHVCNVGDLVLIGLHWNQTGSARWIREDLNNDGVINIGDVTVLGLHWGETW